VVNSNGVCFFFKKAQCIPEINFPEINFPEINFSEINFSEINFPEINFPENLLIKNCYLTVSLNSIISLGFTQRSIYFLREMSYFGK